MNENLSMSDKFLSVINQIIENNLDNENFSVEDLAKKAGLSRSMLHRKLIRFTGKSASDLITEKRLLRAKELLENDVATVSEIAYKVGFNSPSYFTRVYKKNFKVTPGEVRKGILLTTSNITSNNDKEIHNVSIGKIIRVSVIILAVLFILVVIGAGIGYFIRKNQVIEKSIAILPFDNLSSNSENQFIADGIVEDLLSRISQIDGLKVISRTSSEIFRNKGNKTLPEIAQILGVSYILEGTVQRESDSIRINIQLIDAKRDNHILSKQYDRNLEEIFKIQGEISSKIALELSIILTDQQVTAVKKNKTNSLKAFEFYEMGRFQSNRRWIEGYNKGIEYYEKAIAEDPDYGKAYAGLADNYHLMAMQNWIDEREGIGKAREFALKALELDPSLAEAHAVLGSLYAFSDWNWGSAEKELRHALKLNPNYSTAHQYYSELLNITGRPDLAREQINKALELDPFSFVIHHISCLNYFTKKQFKDALAENKVCHELVKDHPWAVRFEFDIYFQLGMKQEAVESFKHYGTLLKYYNPAIADSLFKKEGLDGLLRVKIKTEPNQNFVAYWHVLLGEYDKSIQILESLFRERQISSMQFPIFRSSAVNNDPRFLNLMDKLGLSDY